MTTKTAGTRPGQQGEILLRIEGLKSTSRHPGLLRRHVGDVHAVDGVTFDVYHGETLGWW